jgi:hypothetical protein
MLSVMDESVGAVLAALREHQLETNTLVISSARTTARLRRERSAARQEGKYA